MTVRESQRRAEELQKRGSEDTSGEITEGTIREFKTGCQRWKGETEVVEGASFTSTSGFDIDENTQIG